MISSRHVAEGYAGVEEKSPWHLLLQSLLLDLPEQLENGFGGTSWQDHLVGDPRDAKILKRNWKWSRRIVFSEQAKDESCWLTGRWLIVAYVWGESREMVENVDIKRLVSFGSAFW